MVGVNGFAMTVLVACVLCVYGVAVVFGDVTSRADRYRAPLTAPPLVPCGSSVPDPDIQVLNRELTGATLLAKAVAATSATKATPSPRAITAEGQTLSVGQDAAGGPRHQVVLRAPLPDNTERFNGDTVAVTASFTHTGRLGFALSDGARTFGVYSDGSSFKGCDATDSVETLAVKAGTSSLGSNVVFEVSAGPTGVSVSVSAGSQRISDRHMQTLDVAGHLEILVLIDDPTDTASVDAANLAMEWTPAPGVLADITSLLPCFIKDRITATGSQLNAMFDQGRATLGPLATATLNGGRLDLTASDAKSILVNVHLVEAGSVRADDTFVVSIALDWEELTSHNDVQLVLSDGVRFVGAQSTDAGDGNRMDWLAGTVSESSLTWSAQAIGTLARSMPQTVVLRLSADRTVITLTNQAGDVLSSSFGVTVDLTRQLSVLIGTGAPAEQVGVRLLDISWERATTLGFPVASAVYSGAQLHAAVIAATAAGTTDAPTFPSFRAASVSAAEVQFGVGGVAREILARVPLAPARTINNGDTLTVVAAIDLDRVSGDGDVSFGVSDGGRVIAAVSVNSGEVTLETGCDGGHIIDSVTQTTAPGAHAPQYMPVRFTVEIGPTGSNVIVTDGEGTTVVKAYTPHTIDLGRALYGVVYADQPDDLYAIQQLDIQTTVIPGPPVDHSPGQFVACSFEHSMALTGAELKGVLDSTGEIPGSRAASVSSSGGLAFGAGIRANEVLFRLPLQPALGEDIVYHITMSYKHLAVDTDMSLYISDGTTMVGANIADGDSLGGWLELTTATDHTNYFSPTYHPAKLTNVGEEMPVTLTVHLTKDHSSATVSNPNPRNEALPWTFKGVALDLTQQLVLIVGGGDAAERYEISWLTVAVDRAITEAQQGLSDTSVQLRPSSTPRTHVLLESSYTGRRLLTHSGAKLAAARFQTSGSSLKAVVTTAFTDFARLNLVRGGQLSRSDTVTLTVSVDFTPGGDQDMAFGLATGDAHVGLWSDDSNGGAIVFGNGDTFTPNKYSWQPLPQVMPLTFTLQVTPEFTRLTAEAGGVTMGGVLQTSLDLSLPLDFFIHTADVGETYTVNQVDLLLTRTMAEVGEAVSVGFSAADLLAASQRGDVLLPGGTPTLADAPSGQVLQLPAGRASGVVLRVPVIAAETLTPAEGVIVTTVITYDSATTNTVAVAVSDGSFLAGMRQVGSKETYAVKGCDAGDHVRNLQTTRKGGVALKGDRNQLVVTLRVYPLGTDVMLADHAGERVYRHVAQSLDLTQRLDVVVFMDGSSQTLEVRDLAVTATTSSPRPSLVADVSHTAAELLRNGHAVFPSKRHLAINSDESITFQPGVDSDDALLRYPIAPAGAIPSGDGITVRVTLDMPGPAPSAFWVAVSDGTTAIGLLVQPTRIIAYAAPDSVERVTAPVGIDAFKNMASTFPMAFRLRFNPTEGMVISAVNADGQGHSMFVEETLDVTAGLTFVLYSSLNTDTLRLGTLSMQVQRWAAATNLVLSTPYHNGAELYNHAIDDSDILLETTRTATKSGSAIAFNPSPNPYYYEVGMEYRVADAGTFSNDETVSFAVTLDWEDTTNGAVVVLSDGAEYFGIYAQARPWEDRAAIFAINGAVTNYNGGKFLADVPVLNGYYYNAIVMPMTFTIIQTPTSQEFVLLNGNGNYFSWINVAGFDTDLTQEIKVAIAFQDPTKHYTFNGMSVDVRRHPDRPTTLVEHGSTGRGIVESSNAIILAGLFNVNGDRLDVGPISSTNAPILAQPIADGGSVLSTDTLTVEVVIAWEQVSTSSDALFMVTDGIEAVTAYASSTGVGHMIGKGAWNGLTTPGTKVVASSSFGQTSPLKIKFTLSQSSSSLVFENRDGQRATATFSSLLHLSRPIWLTMLSGSSSQTFGITFWSVVAIQTPSLAPPARRTMPGCCLDGDADRDGICDASDGCWGVDASGDSDSDGVCDSNDLCAGDDCGGDWDHDGICDSVVQCQYGPWSAWSACACSPDGTQATQQRTRSITLEPERGGDACAETEDILPCEDDERPVVSCPSDLSLNFGTSTPSRVTSTGVSATDNSGCVPTVVCDPADTASLGLTASGAETTTTITCRATDPAGLSSSCTYDVTVQDATAPAMTCPSNAVATTAAGKSDARVTFAVEAEDNSGTTTVTCTPASGSVFALGNTEVNCEAVDPSGNRAVCSISVQVNDELAPTIICPSNTEVSTDAGLATASPTLPTPTATDNVGVASVQCDPNGPFALGAHTVTCLAADEAGNQATCSYTVTVVDTEPPVVTCPTAGVTATTDAGTSSTDVSWSAAAQDNADGGGLSVTCTPPPGRFSAGTTTVTCRAEDSASNFGTCSFDVVVADDEAPKPTCPTTAVTANTDAGQPTAVVNFRIPAEDNVDTNPSVTCVPASDSPFAMGTSSVQCTAQDQAGNSATCGFDVVVSDREKPSVTCPADVVQATGRGLPTASVSWTSPVSRDNSGAAPTVVCSPAAGTVFAVGDHAIACTAEDQSGNTQQCSFEVTVNDNQAPVIVCPPNSNVATDPGLGTAQPELVEPTATDNVRVASIACNFVTGDTFPLGATLVTCTATDTSENQQQCSYTVNVEDNEPPVLVCPGNTAKNSDPTLHTAMFSWAVSATDGVDADNVAVACTSRHALEAPRAVSTTGGTFQVGESTITCTATDTAGNPSTCEFIITVNDDEKPVITCPEAITTSTNKGVGTGTAAWPTPDATDNADANPSIACDPIAGHTLFPIGSTTVTCTATDKFDNSGECTFAVTVRDDEAPSLTCPPTTTGTSDAGQPTGQVSWAKPVATDNSGAAPTVSCSPPQTSSFAVGTTGVTCTARDLAGNTQPCIFNVVIQDEEAPVITCPANVNIGTDQGVAVAGLTLPRPRATDNVGIVSQSCDKDSQTEFGVGITTVTCTATDNANNDGSCQFTVTVADDEAPVLNCPADMTMTTDVGAASTTASWSVPATDNVDPSVSATCTPASGSTFRFGDSTVSCVATDVSGNIGTCEFGVTVNDEEEPAITCPTVDPVTLAGETTGTAAWQTPSATDNADPNPTVACLPPSGSSNFDIGSNTVICTATDAFGNAGTCSMLVVVEDTDPPSVQCPADLNDVQMRSDAAVGVAAWQAPIASDVSGGAVDVVCSPLSGTDFAMGTTTVTCTASDPSGNTKDCSFSVTVSDTTAPAVTSCPSDLTAVVPADARANGLALPGYSLPSATDNSGRPVAIACSPSPTTSLGLTAAGASRDHTVECEAVDPDGNTDTSCSFTVSVVDNAAPEVTCPADRRLTTAFGLDVATVAWPANSIVASDNSGAAVVKTCTPASGSDFNVGQTTVQCTVADASDNAGMCSFVVTVDDEQPPAVDGCPSTTVVAATERGMADAAVAFGPITGVDAVDGTLAPAVNDSRALGLDSGARFPLGDTDMEYVFADAAGNRARCAFKVTVEDREAPVVTGCPADVALVTDAGEPTAFFAFTAPTATDNVDGDAVPGVLANPQTTSHDGAFYRVGTTNVAMTFTDAAGNAATCTFAVVVTDDESPVLVNCPGAPAAGTSNSASGNVVVPTDLGAADATTSWNVVSASDNVDLSLRPLTVTSTPTSGLANGDVFPLGTTRMLYTFADASGNPASCSFDVTVEDRELPVIAGCPRDLVVTLSPQESRVATWWTEPNATDNVAGFLAPDAATATHTPGDLFESGVSQVEYIFEDAAGNQGRCAFAVSVRAACSGDSCVRLTSRLVIADVRLDRWLEKEREVNTHVILTLTRLARSQDVPVAWFETVGVAFGSSGGDGRRRRQLQQQQRVRRESVGTATFSFRSVGLRQNEAALTAFLSGMDNAKLLEELRKDDIYGVFEGSTNVDTSPPTVEKSISSNSSSASMMPIIAGAAAGLLLLALVVVVLLRRRGKGGSGAADAPPARDVVAFTNPIYSDKDHVDNKANPIYSDEEYQDPTFLDGQQALYDEPTEGVYGFAAVESEGSGYLDVAPDTFDAGDVDDTGYLDTQPHVDPAYHDVGDGHPTSGAEYSEVFDGSNQEPMYDAMIQGAGAGNNEAAYMDLGEDHGFGFDDQDDNEGGYVEIGAKPSNFQA